MMILDILFPNRCIECDEIITKNEIVCPKCMAKISFTGWNFGDNPLKQKALFLFPVQKAFALMYFDKKGLSRKIIHELKYKGRERIGEIMAYWVAEKIEIAGSVPDLLVSVPLHKKKYKQRGYNQLHLFTETLSQCLGIPFRHDLLKRDRYGKAQARKGKKDRGVTKHNFVLTEVIENKHILLIDDVFTTGNTMNAIAWEILKCKGNKISILVMAMD